MPPISCTSKGRRPSTRREPSRTTCRGRTAGSRIQTGSRIQIADTACMQAAGRQAAGACTVSAPEIGRHVGWDGGEPVFACVAAPLNYYASASHPTLLLLLHTAGLVNTPSHTSPQVRQALPPNAWQWRHVRTRMAEGGHHLAMCSPTPLHKPQAQHRTLLAVLQSHKSSPAHGLSLPCPADRLTPCLVQVRCSPPPAAGFTHALPIGTPPAAGLCPGVPQS